MSLIKKSFYFMRHGSTDWNKERLVMGQKDIPLNAEGINQVTESLEFVKGQKIDLICCSPLLRAKQTAEIINKNLKVPIMEIDNLKECYFGLYEGQKNGQWMLQWLSGQLIENLESKEQFKRRINSGINEALSHSSSALIVSHGAVYYVLQEIMNSNRPIDCANCSLYFNEPLEANNWLISCLYNNSYDVE